MSDILFDFLNEELEIDMVVRDSEIQKDESLRSSVLVSLFTDSRCDAEEVPTGESSRRGFWGDAVFDENTGSKLWLLNRAKRTNDILIKYKEYCEESLQWMQDDGLCNNISVNCVFNGKNKNHVVLNIKIDEKNLIFEV